MTVPPFRPLARMVPVLAALGFLGCAEQPGNEVATTPDEVITPEVPDGADLSAPGSPDEATIVEEETAVVEPIPEPAPIDPDPADDSPDASAAAGELDLPAVTYEELLKHIATGGAKLTLVDCWASWCDPCKENFPHVIEMAEAYGDQGLKVIALSFDAGTEVEDIDASQIAEAKRFLSGMDVSKVENLRHGQLLGESFQAFNVTTIPAVFLYDADGNEVARFTYDDPENQFTYDEVEAKVAELLGVDAKGVVEAAE